MQVWNGARLYSSMNIYNLMFFWPCIMNWLYTWCTDYYLFIKYYSPLHVSSLKCSSSGYSCIHAAYGTVTLYESSWWPVGTQLEWVIWYCHSLWDFMVACPYTAWVRTDSVSSHSSCVPTGHQELSYRVTLPYDSLELCTDRPPGTLIQSDSTICCMYTTVSSWRWALEARNM